MKIKKAMVLISAFTAFNISFWGSIGVALIALKGEMPHVTVWLVALAVGIVSASKDIRSLLKLPPVNGNNGNGSVGPSGPKDNWQDVTFVLFLLASLLAFAVLCVGCNTTRLVVIRPDGSRAEVVNSRAMWTTGRYSVKLDGVGEMSATASKADADAIRAGAEGAASGAMRAALMGVKP